MIRELGISRNMESALYAGKLTDRDIRDIARRRGINGVTLSDVRGFFGDIEEPEYVPGFGRVFRGVEWHHAYIGGRVQQVPVYDPPTAEEWEEFANGVAERRAWEKALRDAIRAGTASIYDWRRRFVRIGADLYIRNYWDSDMSLEEFKAAIAAAADAS